MIRKNNKKRKNKTRKKQSAAVIESLESRTLFSADLFGVAMDDSANDDAYSASVEDATNWDLTEASPTEESASVSLITQNDDSSLDSPALTDSSASEGVRNELVVIDTATPDYQQILDDILSQADESRHIDVVLLDSERDGVEQLSALLSNYSGLDALHIISHGDAGQIALGNDTLDLADLQAQSDAITAWQSAFGDDADLLVYGCDLAATEEGELFVDTLALLTGTDVAASDDLTGSAGYGGDWELEYTVGAIETNLAVSFELQQGYSEVLANAAPVLTGANDFNTINEDVTAPAGNLVSSLIDDQITDADGSVTDGIAVVNVDNTNGTWQYTTDGATWQDVPANTDYENALLLAADSDNALRFIPDADYSGTVSNGVTFHAWDQSSGSDGGVVDITVSEGLRDQFNAASYSNVNDFTGSVVNWTTNWVEVGDDGNPGSGDFTVASNALSLDAKTNGAEISRQADLSSAVSATLSFSYQNDLNPVFGIGNKSIAVEVSSDGGANYDTLFTFDKNNQGGGTQNYDITNYVSANTTVRFVVTDNSISSNTLVIDDFQISYKYPDSGGTTSLSDASFSSDIIVAAINDAPVNTVPGAQIVNEDTQLAIAGISVNDVDSDLSTVQLSVNDGSLNIILSGAASISAGGNDSNTLTLSGTQADINSTLASLRYLGDANFNGSDTLSVVSTDSVGVMDYDSVAITVTAVDDAPVANNDSDTTAEDTALSGDLSGNDTPSGDGGNTWSLNTGPSNGSVTVNADGTFTYTPDDNYNGGDSFSYTITDVDGDTNSATMTITVTSVDDAPTAEGESFITTEDNPVGGDLSTNDEAGDGANNWTVNTGPSNGGLALNTNGTFTYTPNANFNGTDSFTYTITDADGDTATATATIVVTAVNDSPTAVADSFSTAEDTPYAGNLSGDNDTEGDGTNVWSLTTDASNGTVSLNANGTFTYTPNADYNGVDSFTYTLTDADGESSTATVTMTVNAVDDSPVAVDDNYTLNSATPLEGNLASNDTASGDGGNVWAKLTDPGDGAVTVNADGTFTYNPGAVGTYSFTYSVTDADSDISNVATVTLTVDDSIGVPPVNTVPIGQAVNENTSLAIGGISVSDANGNLSTVELSVNDGILSVALDGAAIISAGADGSNTLTISGTPTEINNTLLTLTYQGDGGFNGSDTLVVLSTDTNSLSDYDTVAITVNAVDYAPTAVDDSDSTAEDTGLSGDLSTNDTASADGGNTWSLNTGPSNGSVTVNADGTYTYTPNENYSGNDSFTYTLSDADGDAVTATMNITVTAVDDLPSAVTDSYTVNEDGSVGGDLSTNDSASGDGGNGWALNTGASNGAVTVNGDGTFSYTPTANFNGTDSFTYTITDADGDTSTATVTVVVFSVDDAPTAAVDSYSTNEDTPLSNDVSGNDTASGDGGNVWSLTTDASNGAVVLNADGTFTYTPDEHYNGADSFTYTVTDADGDTSTATVTLTVNAANDPPVNTVPGAQTLNENGSLQIGGISVSDGDGDLTTVRVTVSNGTLNVTLSGASFSVGGNDSNDFTLSGTQVNINATLASLVYSGTANYSGADTLSVISTDSNATTVTDTVAITVVDLNNAPTQISLSTSTVNENVDTSAGYSVGSFITVDPDTGDSTTYTLVGGADEAVFTIGGAGSDELILTNGILDFELKPSYEVIVRVTDSGGLAYDEVLTVSVNDLNEAPVIVSSLSVNAAEEQTVVTKVTAFDEDTADTLLYTITGGADQLQFNISNDGILTFKTPQSFAAPSDVGADGTYVVEITADDQNGLTDVQTITVVLTEANSAPVLAGANNLTTINEDPGAAEPGTLVSALIAGQITDAEVGALEGIAITNVDNTNGTWEYTTDGTTWTAIGNPSIASALLLAADADNAVRFSPNADWNGTVTNGITFHAWDQTSGSDGASGVDLQPTYTLLDQFNTASYSNNDGTQNWTTDWIEVGDGSGATGGDFRISSGELRLDGKSNNDYIYREADLGGAVSATVSFDYDNSLTDFLFGDKEMRFQVSSDGGSSWTTFWTFNESNNGSGSRSADITGYASANTQFRFVVTNADNQNNYLRVENFQVVYDLDVGGVSALSAGSASSSIIINPVNDAAVVTSANVSMAETNAVLTANGTLTSTDVDSPDNSFTVSNTAGTIGNFSIDASGNWNFSANSAFDNLAPLQSVTETFNVTTSDGTASTVQITITGTNDNPTLTTTNIAVTEDQLLAGYDSVAAGATNLLVGATDIDDVDSSLVVGKVNGVIGNVGTATPVQLTYTDADGATVNQNIQLTVNADGTYNLGAFDLSALPTGSLATVTFSYASMDDEGLFSADTNATITITGTNDNPTLTTTNIAATEDQLLAGYDSVAAGATNLLVGAADIDDVDSSLVVGKVNGVIGNVGTATPVQLTYTDADGATVNQNIQLTVNADGTYNLGAFDLSALPTGSLATVTFSYTAMDDEGLFSADTNATITITGTNDNPTLTTTNIAATEDQLLAGYDSVAAGATNLLVGAADIDDVDSSLVVGKVNGVIGNVGTATPVQLTYTDADGAIVNQNIQLTVNADGTYNLGAFDLSALPTGSLATVTFTYASMDDEGLFSADTNATITITGTNDNPTLTTTNIAATEGQLLAGYDSVAAGATNLLVGATDIDDVDSSLVVGKVNGVIGNVGTATPVQLTYTDADGATVNQNIQLTVNADGTYNLGAFDLSALPTGSLATVTFSYASMDDEGLFSADTNASITITGTNDNPTLTTTNIAATEDQLLAGYDSVAAGATNLLVGAADIDDVDSSLVVGKVNGVIGNVGTATPVQLTYTDADGATVNQNIQLTVNADGTYNLGAFDLSALPTGNLATVTFTYASMDDEGLFSADENATITITGTNDNPTLTTTNIAATEDQLLAGYDSVAAGATNLLVGAADIDDVDSSLVVGKVNGVIGNVGTATPVQLTYTDADGAIVNQNIQLTVNADGSYNLGAFDLSALPTGSLATVTFSYTAMDDEGLFSADTNASITITGTNDNPTLTTTNIAATEDQLLAGYDSVAAGATNLLVGAADIDDVDSSLVVGKVNGVIGNVGTATPVQLTYTDADGAIVNQNIQLTVNADGTYDLGAFDLGALPTGSLATVTFTYASMDDEGLFSADTNATITITGTNDNPTLTTTNIAATEDQLLAGYDSVVEGATNLLVGAADIDDVDSSLVVGKVNGVIGNVGTATPVQLTYTDADGAIVNQNIQLTVNADGTYNLGAFDLSALPTGSLATVTFTYASMDDEGLFSADTNASITITGTNDNPTLTTTNIAATEDQLLAGYDSVAAGATNLLVGAADIDDVDSSLVVGKVNGVIGNVGTATPVQLTYTDADGAIVNQNIQLTVNADGTYNLGAFDLSALPTGSLATVTFTYASMDDEGLFSADENATITITGTNDNPTLTTTNIAATEDQLLAGYDSVAAGATNLLVGAADIDDVDSSLVVGKVNGVIGNVGTATPVQLTYTDADGAIVNQNIQLTVNADGSYNLGAFDLSALPTGSLATVTFTYASMDDEGLFSADENATITITGTNDNPTLTTTNIAATEDQLLAGYDSVVEGATNLLVGAADIDDVDSSLVVGKVNGVIGNVGTAMPVLLTYTDADGAIVNQNIQLTVNADGTYNLGAFDLSALPTGSLATVTFSYTAMDDEGLFSADTDATITITGTNDNPTLTAGSINADEDQLEAGYSVNAVTSDLLAGAADIDDVDSSLTVGQVNGLAGNVGTAIPVTLSYIDAHSVAQTQSINLTVNADGSYSLGAMDLDTLPLNSLATVSFTYTSMDDELAESPVRTAIITITGTDDAPVHVVPGLQTISEDTLITISGTSVTDADDTDLSIQLSVSSGSLNVSLAGATTISAGENGSSMLTLYGTKADLNATLAAIEYQGNLNFHGADSLVITSTDSHAVSTTDSVAITVTAVNDAPTGEVVLSGSEVEGQTLTFDTSAIQDVDGLGVFSYQWFRDGVAIAAATETSYILVTEDLGARICVSVTYTDDDATTETVVSAETGPISGDASVSSSDGSDRVVLELSIGAADEDARNNSGSREYEDALAINELPASSEAEGELSAIDALGDVVMASGDENDLDTSKHRDEQGGNKTIVSKFIDLKLELMAQMNGEIVDDIQLLQATSYGSFAALSDELYQLGEDLDENLEDERRAGLHSAEVSVGMSISLTAGVVSWVMRSGSLLMSLLSTAPLWRQIDPLPILGASSSKSTDEEELDHESEAAEDVNATNLENIFRG